MAFKYLRHIGKASETPQTQPISGRGAEMSRNAAGGFGFELDDWSLLSRFLILGTEGGTYYTSERALTLESAESVVRCVHSDGARAVNLIVEVSDSGRAPKNDAAIFALAIASKHGDDATRSLAFGQLPQVCRTGTHLFQFAASIDALGGWGRGARRAVGAWYQDKDPDALAYQLAKYRQRNGWSHADL